MLGKKVWNHQPDIHAADSGHGFDDSDDWLIEDCQQRSAEKQHVVVVQGGS